ncbi:MAG: hypothetical protein ACP5HU_12210 [Phycisphaerae bacterium]
MLRIVFSALLVLSMSSLVGAQEAETPAPEQPAPETVEKLVREGLASYKAGRGSEAIERLQKAISLIQEEMGEDIASYVPDAPEGWTAGEVESSSGSMGGGGQGQQWVRLARTYTRDSDEMKVELTITNSPQLVGTQRAATAMFSNPQYMAMLQSNPDMSIEQIDRDGWNGWLVVDKQSSAQLMAFSGSTMLALEAPKADKAAVETIFEAIDLKGMSEAAGNEQDTAEQTQPEEEQQPATQDE